MAHAFERANLLINGPEASVQLEIKATRQGSFEILLELRQAFESMSGVFAGDFFSGASNLKELFFPSLGGIGLIGLCKRLKGKRPESIQHAPDAKEFILRAEKLELRIPERMLPLYRDAPMRDYLADIMQPLTKDGIESVAFRQNGETLERVEKSDVPSFREDKHRDRNEVVVNRFHSQRLALTAPTFEAGKWRLDDGSGNRCYTVRDEVFLQEVDRQQRSFYKGDVLVCDVQISQFLDDSGVPVRVDREIIKVVDHIHPIPPVQGGLFQSPSPRARPPRRRR